MSLFSPTVPGKLRVDIWSDLACPWCYVGKRRFEQALANFHQRGQLEVVWRSFELDPQAPAHSPLSMRDALASKYGRTPEQAQEMLDSMTRTAAAEGLDYHFERMRPANTFLAHQLIHFAAAQGLQDQMKERLFRASFTEGALLSDLETLLGLAREVGLDAAQARAALQSGQFAQAVRQDEALARELGLSGVPFFVLGGKYGVSGAQSAEVLRAALEQAWQETHPAPLTRLGPDTPAEACQDGQCALPQ